MTFYNIIPLKDNTKTDKHKAYLRLYYKAIRNWLRVDLFDAYRCCTDMYLLDFLLFSKLKTRKKLIKASSKDREGYSRVLQLNRP